MRLDELRRQRPGVEEASFSVKEKDSAAKVYDWVARFALPKMAQAQGM